MHSNAFIARNLAAAFVSGKWATDSLVDRGSRLLGRRWRWLRRLARHVIEEFDGRLHPRQSQVAEFILHDRGFLRACERESLRLRELIPAPCPMRPIRWAEPWEVPSICDVGILAEWLGVTTGELEWFADLRSLERKCNQGRLRHYHYRPLSKRFGQVRLVEAPKSRLKHIQRQILSGILERVPPHDAAHGFRKGRSIKTFVSDHVSKRVVLRWTCTTSFRPYRWRVFRPSSARSVIPKWWLIS